MLPTTPVSLEAPAPMVGPWLAANMLGGLAPRVCKIADKILAGSSLPRLTSCIYVARVTLVAASVLQLGLCAGCRCRGRACDDVATVCAGLDLTFWIIFALEACVKLGWLRKRYFEKRSNCLDFVLAWLVPFLDACVLPAMFGDEAPSSAALALLRLPWLLCSLGLQHAARVHRIPRVLVGSAVAFGRALLWLAPCFACALYAGGTLCVDLFGNVGDSHGLEYAHFASLPRSVLTMVGLGLLSDWSTVLHPLLEVSPVAALALAFSCPSLLLLAVALLAAAAADGAAATAAEEKRAQAQQRRLRLIREAADRLFVATSGEEDDVAASMFLGSPSLLSATEFQEAANLARRHHGEDGGDPLEAILKEPDEEEYHPLPDVGGVLGLHSLLTDRTSEREQQQVRQRQQKKRNPDSSERAQDGSVEPTLSKQGFEDGLRRLVFSRSLSRDCELRLSIRRIEGQVERLRHELLGELREQLHRFEPRRHCPDGDDALGRQRSYVYKPVAAECCRDEVASVFQTSARASKDVSGSKADDGAPGADRTAHLLRLPTPCREQASTGASTVRSSPDGKSSLRRLGSELLRASRERAEERRRSPSIQSSPSRDVHAPNLEMLAPGDLAPLPNDGETRDQVKFAGKVVVTPFLDSPRSLRVLSEAAPPRRNTQQCPQQQKDVRLQRVVPPLLLMPPQRHPWGLPQFDGTNTGDAMTHSVSSSCDASSSSSVPSRALQCAVASTDVGDGDGDERSPRATTSPTQVPQPIPDMPPPEPPPSGASGAALAPVPPDAAWHSSSRTATPPRGNGCPSGSCAPGGRCPTGGCPPGGGVCPSCRLGYRPARRALHPVARSMALDAEWPPDLPPDVHRV